MQMMMNTMLGVLWSGDTRYTPDTAAGQWRVITNSNLSLGLQLSAPAQPGPILIYPINCVSSQRAEAGKLQPQCGYMLIGAGVRGAAAACWLQPLHWPWPPHNLLNFMFIVIANIIALPRMPSRSLGLSIQPLQH